MSSPSLGPLIDTCQKCSTSPANHEPRSPANGVFKIQGFVRKRFLPSPPLPPPFFLLALAPFSAQVKYRKPRSSVFLCSQTLRKRLLRRLPSIYAVPTFVNIEGEKREHCPNNYVLDCSWFFQRSRVQFLFPAIRRICVWWSQIQLLHTL